MIQAGLLEDEAASGEGVGGFMYREKPEAGLGVLLWSELSAGLDQCLRFWAPSERLYLDGLLKNGEREKIRRHFPGFQTTCLEGIWETRK